MRGVVEEETGSCSAGFPLQLLLPTTPFEEGGRKRGDARLHSPSPPGKEAWGTSHRSTRARSPARAFDVRAHLGRLRARVACYVVVVIGVPSSSCPVEQRG